MIADSVLRTSYPTRVRGIIVKNPNFSINYFVILGLLAHMGLINKVDMVCLSPVGYGV